jgi:hypothetical protein
MYEWGFFKNYTIRQLISFKNWYLRVQRKGVESHWANESDVCGLRVEDLVVRGDPQARVLRQHLHHLKILNF